MRDLSCPQPAEHLRALVAEAGPEDHELGYRVVTLDSMLVADAVGVLDLLLCYLVVCQGITSDVRHLRSHLFLELYAHLLE